MMGQQHLGSNRHSDWIIHTIDVSSSKFALSKRRLQEETFAKQHGRVVSRPFHWIET